MVIKYYNYFVVWFILWYLYIYVVISWNFFCILGYVDDLMKVFFSLILEDLGKMLKKY